MQNNSLQNLLETGANTLLRNTIPYEESKRNIQVMSIIILRNTEGKTWVIKSEMALLDEELEFTICWRIYKGKDYNGLVKYRMRRAL
jgi:hypothetical protein